MIAMRADKVQSTGIGVLGDKTAPNIVIWDGKYQFFGWNSFLGDLILFGGT